MTDEQMAGIEVHFVLTCSYIYITEYASVLFFSSSTAIGNIQNYYIVWLNTSLQVNFNSSDSCSDYHLFFPNKTEANVIWSSESVDGVERLVTFTIPFVTSEFDNITMTLKVVSHTNPPFSQTFFIYTQGTDKIAHTRMDTP